MDLALCKSYELKKRVRWNYLIVIKTIYFIKLMFAGHP